MTVVLYGVLTDDWVAQHDPARAIASSLAEKGQVAYRIETHVAARAGGGQEKRVNERRRSRLRSGKLLDSANRFLCECLVHDRSASGLRLKLLKNIGLPNRCRLYDDETGEVRLISTVWRRNSLLGVRYCACGEPAAIKESMRSALRGRYYAIPD